MARKNEVVYSDPVADTTIRILSALNFLFGAWLLASPYLLNYNSTRAYWEQTAGGALVMLLALTRFFSPAQAWASWAALLTGIWMIVAPFLTGYQALVTYWNEVIFGILIVLITLSAISTRRTTHIHRSSAA